MQPLMCVVCIQAEQDILHRNSLDAARRNSFCADVDAQRQDMQYPYTGLPPALLMTKCASSARQKRTLTMLSLPVCRPVYRACENANIPYSV